MYDRILDLLLEAAIPQGTGPLRPGRMPIGSKKASKRAAMGAAASIKPTEPYDDTFRKEQQDMEDKLDSGGLPERQEDEVESQAAKEGERRMKDNDAEKEQAEKEQAEKEQAAKEGLRRMKMNDDEKAYNEKWGVGGIEPKRKYRTASLSDKEYAKYKKDHPNQDPAKLNSLDGERARMQKKKGLDRTTSVYVGSKLGTALGSAMTTPLVTSKPPKKFM